MAKLKNKAHELFCQEYLIDLDATQAYLRAGYKTNAENARRASHRLKNRPEVAARIDELMDKRCGKMQISQNDVLKRLVEVLDKCTGKQKIIITVRGKTAERLIFDAREANKSLELLGKHLGMFKDKLDVDINGGVRIIDDIRRDFDGR